MKIPPVITVLGFSYKLFHMGELPGVQQGENFLIHFNDHMDFFEAGGTDAWQPERRQAFFDHLQKTGNMLMWSS